jgi:hypothetical protein
MSDIAPPPVAPAGTPFSATAAIGYGWRKSWKSFWWILLLNLVVTVVFIVVNLIGGGANFQAIDVSDPQSLQDSLTSTSVSLLTIVGIVIQFLVTVLIYLGLVRIGLDVTSGQRINVGRLFSFKGYGRYLAGNIILSILIGIGFGVPLIAGISLTVALDQIAYAIVGGILGVILAILLSLGFSVFGFTILDKDVRGLGSLGASWALVKPRFGSLLGMYILLTLLLIAVYLVAIIGGVLMLIVGLLITLPVAGTIALGITFLAQAYAYRTLSGEEVR